jgi:hypothetical protein
MTSTIMDGTQIDTSVFSYSAPKAHASGGKVVKLYNKRSRESLTISTPLLLTWGAQESKDQQGNCLGKWTMSLQFPSSEYPNPDGEAFLKSMRELEAKVKADAMTYSKEWFGKTITSPDVMDEKFNLMLRYPKIKGTLEPDYDRAPTMTVKLPCWSGVWKSEIYDEDGEPLYVNGKTSSQTSPLEFLPSKAQVICLIQCGGLWFVNGKVSITWNVKQAMVQRPKGSMIGQCFLKPKAADVEKLKTSVREEEDDEDDAGVSATIVDDSDDECAPEEEVVVKTVFTPPAPEPTPAAAPVPTPVAVAVDTTETIVKKKRVLKKKSDE